MRYRLEYALFRFVAALMSLLPVETASAASGAIWRWLAPFSKRHRRALANLKAAYPNLSDEEHVALASEMWDTMGRIFAESFRLKEIAASGRVVLDDPERIKALLKDEHGFVICAAHQGNWEVAVAGLPQLGYQAAGIYQRLKNPFVDAAARRFREPLYAAGLFPKGQQSARAALRHVKNGGALSIMADLRENRGVRVPFFGREAPSTPFPAMLAVTLGKKLLLGAVIREPGVRFRIQVNEIEVVRTGDRDADIIATTANLQRKIEEHVRARPGQWMWGHRRWG